jgi:hypothetical protein
MYICSIPIHERVELPESWIPADSRVEIDAKITAGKFLRTPTSPPAAPVEEDVGVVCDRAEIDGTRLFHNGTSNDGRRIGCGQRKKLGRVSGPWIP